MVNSLLLNIFISIFKHIDYKFGDNKK